MSHFVSMKTHATYQVVWPNLIHILFCDHQCHHSDGCNNNKIKVIMYLKKLLCLVVPVFHLIVSLASSSCKYRSFVLTQRGWKHTAGHVREDRPDHSVREAQKMTQTFTFQGQSAIKSAQQPCKTISLIFTTVSCEVKNEKNPLHLSFLEWSQHQLYQYIQRDGNLLFRSRNYINQVCHCSQHLGK